MRACQVLDYGQSQSGTAHISRTRAIHSIKSFKQPFKMLSGNPLASVFNNDFVPFSGFAVALYCFLTTAPFLVSLNATFKFDCYHSILPVELDPILHQIREHLLKSTCVCEDHRIAGDGVA